MLQGSSASAEQRTGYRVEVLVLHHLEGWAEPDPVAELPDLTGVLDLRQRALDVLGEGTVPEDPFYLGPAEAELRPPLGPFPDEEGPWAQIELLENRSERMNTVWRNLRLSGEFRPEAFLAWEQPADEPFPLLRIHNEEIIKVDDLFAPERAAGSAYVFTYVPERGGLELTPIPDPEYHYAVDGSVRLRRSRFLHLDVDIALRRPWPLRPGISGPPLLPEYLGYQVFPLRQSRQVRTGRMEYFDAPVLGLLLWVSEIQLDDGKNP